MARKPTKTLADYPHLVAQLHPTKNGDIDPSKIAAGSHLKLWWKCSEGKWPDGTSADDHEWEAAVSDRCQGNGCRCCRGLRAVPSNCLATTYPELAAQWHPTKNGSLTPFDVVAKSNKEVWWKCGNGRWPNGDCADDHEWKAKICNRSNGRGCPCCRGLKAVPSNCLSTTHPELAAQWHPTKNGAVTPNGIVAGCNKRFWWKCSNGKWPDGSAADDHEWEATVNDRYAGYGCPCCVGKKAVRSNCLATTHPELASQWCSKRNAGVTPCEVTFGCNEKAWWQCPKCSNTWCAVIANRAGAGYGCPKCSLSKGEGCIRKYLDAQRIRYKAQWHQSKSGLGRSRFDFAVNRWERLWFIEFHGIQHYVPKAFGSKKDKAKYRLFVDTVKRDLKKQRWLEARKKSVLVIPYWDFDRIEEILDEFFFLERTPTISEPPAIVKKYESMRQKILDYIQRTDDSTAEASV